MNVYNSAGAALMENPELKGGKPTMFICGNDESAKPSTTQILDQFGWGPPTGQGGSCARD